MIRAVDLFCGGGGTSTGLARAALTLGRDVDLLAINHWGVAVETHKAAHPWARHLCATLDSVNPREVAKGRINLLVASPECTHHSIARGGKPVSDQSRASAWQVVSWVEALRPDEVLVENVREFRSWGPIGSNGRPMKSRRGETYAAWLNGLRSLGYTVEERVLNAADYGDATTRERLFVRAHRGRGPVAWPMPSHAKAGGTSLFPAARWRAAREIIDWSIPGASIFTRKRPLSPKTLERIAEGLRRFGGTAAEPFLVMLTHGGRLHSVDKPLPTVTTANRGEVALAQPFMVGAGGPAWGGGPRSIDEPMGTVVTRSHRALVEPFVVGTGFAGANGTQAWPADRPLPTVVAGGRGFGVCEPFVVTPGGPDLRGGRSIDSPLPTVVCRDRLALVRPFIVPQFGEAPGQRPRTHSIDEPAPAVTSHGAGALVTPFILPHRQFDGMQVDAVDAPLRTVTAHNGGDTALVEPFVSPYYGSSTPRGVDEPLGTVTGRDRFALVEPGARLDIRFRMLQKHELAAAMGFPRDYPFAGNQGEVIRQIGNAVCVNMAEALCRAALAGRAA